MSFASHNSPFLKIGFRTNDDTRDIGYSAEVNDLIVDYLSVERDQ